MTPRQLEFPKELNQRCVPAAITPRAFDGETYERHKDHDRLSRQYDRVLDLMQDGKPHTLRELADRCECSEASASARLRDMRKGAFGAHIVHREPVAGRRGLFMYRLET